MTLKKEQKIGATLLPEGGVLFKVWAPTAERADVLCKDERIPMRRDRRGYFTAKVKNAKAGNPYFYLLDGRMKRPDPASRFQPEGVHGPSEIVDARFAWTDRRWKKPPLKDLIFYELHVGLFTPRGNFDSVRTRLSYLKKIGVTCLEIMPVAQFPGTRNWGYDGACLYAPQNSYGGPPALKRLIDACHAAGLAVCLDVVYNHFGPEGNYLRDFGPYFTSRHHTPWGDAVNFDGEDSKEVRRFFIENALYWANEYHVDALRLDAVHAIHDESPRHILREIKEKLGDAAYVIAEYEKADDRPVRPVRRGGYGLDAQWSDDFHHAMHVTLTGEREGYYSDFSGLEHVATAAEKVFVRGPASDLPAEKFVHCLQNHDQIGNRAWGDRLSGALSFEAQKASAALLFFLPGLPLIFMGQEYGEKAPFRYFIDHEDRQLVEAVRQGRREEFKAFGWEEIPDPKDERTFLESKLDWTARSGEQARQLQKLYQDLIQLRKKYDWAGGVVNVRAEPQAGGSLIIRRATAKGEFLLHVNLGEGGIDPLPGDASLLFDSQAPRYGALEEGPRAFLGIISP